MSSYNPSSYDPNAYDPSAFVAPPPGGGNRTANVPGRIALIAAVVMTLFQLGQNFFFHFASTDMAMGLSRAVDLLLLTAEGLLALLATLLGAIGLGGGGHRPRGAAAAGLALGVSTLLFILSNTLIPWLV